MRTNLLSHELQLLHQMLSFQRKDVDGGEKSYLTRLPSLKKTTKASLYPKAIILSL